MRQVVGFVIVGLAVGCVHTAKQSDSCTRIREFRQFSHRPASYGTLPNVDLTALGPEVGIAVAAFSRRLIGDDSLVIRNARESPPYILLELSGACFDCKRWVVYSPERKCVVGAFVLAGQG